MTENILDIIENKIKEHQNIVFERLSNDELEIHPNEESCFPILIQREENENTLYLKAYHNHFENSEEGDDLLLDYLYLALTGLARVEEYSRNEKIFKSVLQIKDENGEWKTQGATILLNISFWKRPKIKYYQNKLMEYQEKYINGL